MLNGAKVWADNLGIAEVYCVACNTDPSQGDDRIALIYMEVPNKGFTFGGFEEKAGLLGGRDAIFISRTCVFPRIGGPRGPAGTPNSSKTTWSFYRIVSGALAVGMAQGAFDVILSSTSVRIAAGKPIRQHTIDASMLADIAISIQVGRDAYTNVAYMYDRP